MIRTLQVVAYALFIIMLSTHYWIIKNVAPRCNFGPVIMFRLAEFLLRFASDFDGTKRYEPQDMATGRSSRITSAGQPGAGVMDVGKCPVVRWRDVGQEGVMTFMAPILADNKPFLLTGYWSHQVLHKDATQRWRSFQGIKSVLIAHGLEELRECAVFVGRRLVGF